MSTHPAVQYLKALFADDDTVCLTFISATKTYANGNAFTENVFLPLSKVITDAGIKRLMKRNEKEHIFISMAPFKAGSIKRTKDNISEARHIFVDADENGPAVLAAIRAEVDAWRLPPPAVVVESSPNKYQVIWNVEGFSIELQEALNKTLMMKFGTDPKAVDAARVLRVAGFKNIKSKYADPKPVATIIEQNEGVYGPEDFSIPLAVEPEDNSTRTVADDKTIQTKIDLLTAAMDAASVGYTNARKWGGGFLFELKKCPWSANHSAGETGAVVIVQPSGAYAFTCQHEHCSDKKWDQFRALLEAIVGHALAFVPQPSPKSSSEKPADGKGFTESGNSPPSKSLGAAAANDPASFVEPEHDDTWWEQQEAKCFKDSSPTVIPVPSGRPVLSEDALYGVLGRIIRKLAPETESHPAGNLLELMACLGSVMGRNAYFEVENTKHFCNLFVVRVGLSSRSRKGTGRDRIAEILRQIDPEWLNFKNTSGIGSGEAIIWTIRDRVVGPVQNKRTHEWTTEIIDPGVDNKTLHVSEGEFVGIITVAGRRDNIVSKILRDGWDGKPLRNTVKTAPAVCLEPYISLSADITKTELLYALPQNDKFNGFANRFLWAHVERQGLKPYGGEPIDWTPEVLELSKAIQFAHSRKRVFMDHNARRRWARLYEDMAVEEPGIVGSVTSRAEAQVIRLAIIFAMMDKSEHIQVEHLNAAYAVWQYNVASAKFIFGDAQNPLTPDQAKLLEFVRQNGPQNRTKISVDCFGRNILAAQMTTDIETLVSRGLVTSTTNGTSTVITAVKRSS